MQLRQAEAFRMFNHHQGRIRHVDADFNDGRRHQHMDVAAAERIHDRLLFSRLQAAMHEADLQVRQCRHQCGLGFCRGLQLQRFRFFDQRTDPIRLAAFERGRVHALDDFIAPVLVDVARHDRRAPGRQFINGRHFQVRVIRHGQRARNRRGRHHQLMRHVRAAVGIHALVAQREALADAETMLFIDNDKTEPREMHGILEDRMRANDELRRAIGNRGLRERLVFFPEAAREPGDRYAQRREPLRDLAEMLFREDFRRRHQDGLVTAVDGLRGRERGDDRLAAADIALQEPLHRKRCAHVCADFREHALLRTRELEWQGAQEALAQRALRGQRRCAFFATRHLRALQR